MNAEEKIENAISVIDQLLIEGDKLKEKSDDEYKNSKVFLACEMLKMVKRELS